MSVKGKKERDLLFVDRAERDGVHKGVGDHIFREAAKTFKDIHEKVKLMLSGGLVAPDVDPFALPKLRHVVGDLHAQQVIHVGAECFFNP